MRVATGRRRRMAVVTVAATSIALAGAFGPAHAGPKARSTTTYTPSTLGGSTCTEGADCDWSASATADRSEVVDATLERTSPAPVGQESAYANALHTLIYRVPSDRRSVTATMTWVVESGSAAAQATSPGAVVVAKADVRSTVIGCGACTRSSSTEDAGPVVVGATSDGQGASSEAVPGKELTESVTVTAPAGATIARGTELRFTGRLVGYVTLLDSNTWLGLADVGAVPVAGRGSVSAAVRLQSITVD